MLQRQILIACYWLQYWAERHHNYGSSKCIASPGYQLQLRLYNNGAWNT